jgi:hypothetical protein
MYKVRHIVDGAISRSGSGCCQRALKAAKLVADRDDALAGVTINALS